MTRVLVSRLDNTGDVLLAGPAVRAVAATAEVVLLCGPRGRAAGELLPGVTALRVFEAPWIDPEPEPVHRAAIDAVVDDLAALNLDQAVVLTSFHQSPLPLALLLRMAGVPTVVAISDDYPGSLLDVRHRIADEHLHEVERALSLVATLGYRLPPGDDGRLRIRRTTPPNPPVPRPYVVVHPGASVPARAWAPERHAALVDELVDRGHRVVVTGGPAERDLTAAVAGPSRRSVLDLGGGTELAALADVVAGADGIVTGNTGPAHLAAAVGTPVVSLFAPTVPVERWGPYRVRAVVLGDQAVPCAGCRARTCPVAHQPCLGIVTPSGVADAVELVAAEERRSA